MQLPAAALHAAEHGGLSWADKIDLPGVVPRGRFAASPVVLMAAH